MRKLDLSKFFTTKAEAKDFSDRLVMLESEIYEIDFELEKTLKKLLGIKRKEYFITLLREHEVPLDSPQHLGEFLEKVKESISKMPEATIAAANEPDQETLDSISSWFVLNLEKQVLIDIEIKPDLIGGAIINYKGRRYDGSIRNIFKSIFTEVIKTWDENNNMTADNQKNSNKN